jgi:putative YhdH/YhfP family quinone oxidoreductase
MKDRTYTAYVVREVGDGRVAGGLEQKGIADLPAGDVLVRVRYSSLNYKDALSASGNRGVTRRYPHTPGIDAAGVVEESQADGLSPGDPVVVSGYDLGMNTPGGFGQYIRVPADWVTRLTPGLTLKESMILGTAGFTAGLSVHELVAAGVTSEQGEILVTGATGGVGSFSVGILSKLGYSVVAVSGKAGAETLLRPLGAGEVIARESFRQGANRALLSGRWAGVVDTVGGDILATAIKSTRPAGVVTCCGNAASAELPLTVYPFILRGVTLKGIACQRYSVHLRKTILAKLANEWRLERLDDLHDEISLAELGESVERMLQGRLPYRAVINLDR